DRGCRRRRREDDRCRRKAPEHRAALGRRSAEENDPPRDRQIAGETASGGAAAQVSGAGLRRDFEDFAVLGERAEIAALPGVRNATSGTSPPRGAASKAIEGGPGREGQSHELQPDGKPNFAVPGRALEGRRTPRRGEASRDVRGVPAARERISRGERIAG